MNLTDQKDNKDTSRSWIIGASLLVLSDVSPLGKRAKTLSLASSVWGISSLIGPTLGGGGYCYLFFLALDFFNEPAPGTFDPGDGGGAGVALGFASADPSGTLYPPFGGLLSGGKKCKGPYLKFFKIPGFALGNSIGFCASFSTFSLFAYAPLFLQGALGATPLQVGYAMLSLSLGWSLGSLHQFSRTLGGTIGVGLCGDGHLPAHGWP